MRIFRRFIFWRVAGCGPVVAITFDDGPNDIWTPRVLNILAQYGVRATFFLQANRVEEFPELARRIVADGHEIGSHGYDHKRRDSRSQAATADRVLRKFGIQTRFYRPPGGAVGIKEVLWLVSRGFTTVLWSLDAVDSLREEGKWTAELPDYSRISDGDVVLMHDDNETCIRELPHLLDTLSQKGLKPVTLSRLVE
jgi:peptidoglycan/xylan/chitin deacetylase (PgdA/CDA1 family)